MKKPLLILLAALFTISVKAQIKDTVGLNLPLKEGKIYYEGIVEVPGKTKTQLYASAKRFLLESFVSSKAVIESEDKEDGNISGKGINPVILKLNFLYNGNFSDEMIIQIDCKDGKYRYRFYDFRLKPTGFVGNTPNAWPEANYNDLLGDLIGTSKTHYTKKQEIFLLKDNDNDVRNLIAKLHQKMILKNDDF
jgi:hypothetical protein